MMISENSNINILNWYWIKLKEYLKKRDSFESCIFLYRMEGNVLHEWGYFIQTFSSIWKTVRI